MAWPTPQDYNEAVQNPPFTFSDPELQRGSCEVTALGLPRPITGNFASVYRVRCSGRDWAVRCFWRELSDMQQRYQAISAHLAAAGLTYTVGFEYQPQGIRVRGRWYPILKMEWVEGELLNQYLAAHLQDPVALRALMDRWLRMVSELERVGCAHGDLQHGNVLVVDGELKLVDYDGMFVPALAGMSSHELGQQHYQHPLRSAADFGPHLDRFSSWVIYLSISALQTDPSLWSSMQAGDERLLLKRHDFENPASSISLALLTDHADVRLQSLALKFRGALDEPIEFVPCLSTALTRAVARSEERVLPAGRFAWRLQLLWRCVAPSVETCGGMHLDRQTGSHPAWVIDHLPARRAETALGSNKHAPAVRIAVLAALPMVGVGAIVLLAIGVPIMVATALVILVWGMANLVACIVAYRQEAAVQTLLPLVRREAQILRRLAEAERITGTIATKRETTVRRNTRAEDEAAACKAELERQERAKHDTLLELLTRKLEAIDMRIYEVGRREAEETELALGELQQRHIAEILRRATLRSAAIAGIGTTVKLRLWSLGIWAAADVSSERISSMQHLKHDHLMAVVAWRVETETSARRTMPRRLPIEVTQTLHHGYARERIELVAERKHQQASTQQAMEEVEAEFLHGRERIDKQLTELLEDRMQECARLEAQLLGMAAQGHAQRDRLRAVRHEINNSEGAGFGRFVQSIYLPWTREEST